jgi:hypothetical protein
MLFFYKPVSIKKTFHSSAILSKLLKEGNSKPSDSKQQLYFAVEVKQSLKIFAAIKRRQSNPQ